MIPQLSAEKKVRTTAKPLKVKRKRPEKTETSALLL